ncbi:lytic transglycosylase domain-containing protein [Tautonia plasticadhaerens]|uniref:Transglycosylase SLT domain protein n=1 Tax=Tautonia plasticadhaerens TaxID=2527974 RepID=A0A518H278_9BACT|nr:transglycosylase SLT domain-containing protein [Tautonia plasticadhaerens]QDV34945.1 Transglycosylase SLT domain protein [Tautonia plasticadhaerens]
MTKSKKPQPKRRPATKGCHMDGDKPFWSALILSVVAACGIAYSVQSQPIDAARSASWVITAEDKATLERANRSAAVEAQELVSKPVILQAPKKPEAPKEAKKQVAKLDAKQAAKEEARQKREAEKRVLYDLAYRASIQEGVDPYLYIGLLKSENSFKTSMDVSSAGAIGPAQLLASTAAEMGLNPWNLEQNVTGGARYLKRKLDSLGQEALAIASYNMGEGALKGWMRKGGHPERLPAETKTYVMKVQMNAAYERHQGTLKQYAAME